MKKLLCLLLCLLLPFSAFGAARMPQQRGSINDAADILSAQTVADLADFGKRLSQRCQVDWYVATVHFLDGMDIQTYASGLFEKWELDATDLLLVGAAGEDSFASVMGAEAEKTLGRINTENLLYTSSDFASLFRTQQYDAAMEAYAQGLNTLVEKQTGSGVRMDGLFGATNAATSFELKGRELWQQAMETVAEHKAKTSEKENGLTVGGWIVLIVLFSVLFRQKRRKHNWRSGCGCSPLGWLIGLLGLGFLFDRK